jgi:PadR family transcriptional regulator PadR
MNQHCHFPAPANNMIDIKSIYIDICIMRKPRAPSKATKKALIALLNAPESLHGYEIMQITEIKPGTLYPMLARLEDQAMLASQWQEASVEGRPPRHIYSLTETGRVLAKSLLQEDRPDVGQQLRAKPI